MAVGNVAPYVHAEPGERDLKMGMRGDDVTTLQRFLRAPDTGEYDDATRMAVLRYQDRMRLDMTGECGRETWAAAGFVRIRKFPLGPDEFFGIEEVSKFCGARKLDQQPIVRIQRKLGIEMTGRYDMKTKLAVMRRQRILGLDPHGMVDKQTWIEFF